MDILARLNPSGEERLAMRQHEREAHIELCGLVQDAAAEIVRLRSLLGNKSIGAVAGRDPE